MEKKHTQQAQRPNFIFLRSYYKTAQNLEKYNPDKTDGKKLKAEFIGAVVEYALNGTLPKFDRLVLQEAWKDVEQQINFGFKQWSNGSRGGAPKGNKNAVKKK